MKKCLFFLLFITSLSFSQGIVIDTTSLTIPQLVRTVLMGNSCSNEINFVYSSHRGIGKFTNTNPNFPFANGILIRNGIAKFTQGPYTGNNESTIVNTSRDADLQSISNNNGQTATITDVGFIQFDFTPISNNFSFDFLFASNEYGQYQCGFSDVFAFLLTDLTTNVKTNLAVIPSTSTPVTVKNIRNAAFNSSCLSNNPNLFGRYNVTNPTTAPINMRGETLLLRASSPVIPNRTYRIKLAIGDYLDSNFDSAVFIKGGSFTTTTDLGPDQMICQGENIILNSGILPPFQTTWTLNGVPIVGQTGTTLVVTQPGRYGVIGTLGGSGCRITDEIIISNLVTNTINDITVCNSGQTTYQFNLTQNNLTSLGLNPTDYSLLYFASLVDANANSPQIPLSQLLSYSSIGGEIIYIKVKHLSNSGSICNDVIPFHLVVNPPVIAAVPSNVSLCNVSTGSLTYDLTLQNSIVLNGQPAANFILSYFNTQTEALTNTNPILNPSVFPVVLSQSPVTIWVRMSDVLNSRCFDIVNFDITVFSKPLVDTLPNVMKCHNYTLPVITNGNYFTGSNGTGTMLFAGDIITVLGTYYILNGPDANGCTNQSSFVITLIDQITFPLTACGKYKIPTPPAGNFYTGPSGTGSVLTPGTFLTTSQTIYYYAIIDGSVCRDTSFAITVFPLPLVDTLQNVLTCDSYVLPTLINGNYFTGTGGTGSPLFAGASITTSQTIYIYAFDGRCPNQTLFRVNIVKTTLYISIIRCGSYTLPAIPFGSYRDQPSGGGNSIPSGTIITTSQIVYYYAVTTTFPNCTINLNYNITIKPLPLVDAPANRLECQNYTLPALTNGNYFTAINGGGTQLNAGDIISSTKTIYVFSIGINGCTNQSSFRVEIRPLPLVDSFTDILTCTDYVLLPLRNGTYYTKTNGPHGIGTVIPVGTAISTDQRIYIYNEWSDFTTCHSETYFNLVFRGVEVGTFANVNACDSYVLRLLNVGNYYSQPNGIGPLPVGTIITNSQTVYVYEILGTRITCSDEALFIVNITHTPILISRSDVVACESYILPALAVGGYFSGSNATGTQYFAGDIITSSQLMHIIVYGDRNGNCSAEDAFNITIYPLNDLVINGGVICVNSETGALLQSYQLVSGLNPSVYRVEWYLNGVLKGIGTNYTATEEGTYTVIPIKITQNIGNDCGYNATRVVVEKSSPAVATVTVSAAFQSIIDIIVNVTNGFGTYEYQIDNGAFQTDNVFYDVASGTHNIIINDTKGDCGAISLLAHVIKYPDYFTPNGDGYHDTWNIFDLDFQPDARLYIYDRYGKLLKHLSTTSEGWDGIYNGSPLPSTDYWFQVFYKFNGASQEFKAHFSLKR